MVQIEYVQNKESGLSVRTKINQAIEGVNSLNSTKVDKVTGSRLLTNSEADSIAAAVNSDTLSTELAKKVDKDELNDKLGDIETILESI